jgi:hypothetical protein
MGLRKPGNFENYTEQEDKTFTCNTCGSIIQAVTVSHSVHLHNLVGAGFGEVKTTQEPYCPNCEEKPNEIGSPIYYD